MARVYIDNWSGFKYNNEPRLVGAYAEWNLVAQKVEFLGAFNGALDNEVIFQYKISGGSITGKARTSNQVYMHVEASSLAVDHKIKIQSYEGTVPKDDDSMYTKDAPIL